jgi:hypothetical protein
MPVLHYDKTFKDMPDLRKEQKCDNCGYVGRKMYYSYPDPPLVLVFCRKCAKAGWFGRLLRRMFSHV